MKNPVFYAITLALLFFVFPIDVQGESPLPLAAEETLEKLSEWESDQISATKLAIEQKRLQVVALLEVEMKKRTKEGDLDGAVAIQKEIHRITAIPVELEFRTPVRVPSGPDGWTPETLQGTSWDLKGESILVFHAGGVLEMRSAGGRVLKKDTWYLREDGVLELRWDGRTTHKELVKFQPDGRSGIYGRADKANLWLVGTRR